MALECTRQYPSTMEYIRAEKHQSIGFALRDRKVSLILQPVSINHGKVINGNHVLRHGGGLQVAGFSFSTAEQYKCASNTARCCEEITNLERTFMKLQDKDNIAVMLNKVTISTDHATRWARYLHIEVVQ